MLSSLGTRDAKMTSVAFSPSLVPKMPPWNGRFGKPVVVPDWPGSLDIPESLLPLGMPPVLPPLVPPVLPVPPDPSSDHSTTVAAGTARTARARLRRKRPECGGQIDRHLVDDAAIEVLDIGGIAGGLGLVERHVEGEVAAPPSA